MDSFISFKSDYFELGHPRLIEALGKAAMEQNKPYGHDVYSEKAAGLIRELADSRNADVHLVSGGTQTNLVCLCHILKPYESVIACDTAHISVYETGAIEATGHKINTVANSFGKLTAGDIEGILESHESEHMVLPKVVFISQSTELGTIYSKAELAAISRCCRENGLYLYIDGARLGSALVAADSDLSLADLASHADMFYIGGTKNGSLMGEAVVIVNDNLKENFRFTLKRRGAILAKGAAHGIQFYEFFKDGLYMDLARHANAMAYRLADMLKQSGATFAAPPQTNMIFPILPIKTIERLEKDFLFYRRAKVTEDTQVIRLVTSWATPEESVEAFGRAL